MAAALDPNALAAAISAALPQAWTDVKNTAFTGNVQDVQPMFLAISRGLVTYLEAYLRANQTSLIASMNLSAAGALPIANSVSNLALSIGGV